MPWWRNKEENGERALPCSRRPHPRHRRGRRNRRSSGRIDRGPRTAGAARSGGETRGRGCRGTSARRDRLARRREFPELAISRPGATARGKARHQATALLLRSGRRRESDPLSARSGAAHRARRDEGRRGLRRGGAIDRDQGRARQSHAAVDAVRARRARAEARRGVSEADGGDARRVQADHRLSALRSGHLSALGPDAARGAGGIRRAVVALFGSRSRQSAVLDEARSAGRHDHDAFARQSADRMALHQTDGGEPDRQHGRSLADDIARPRASRRHRRGSH